MAFNTAVKDLFHKIGNTGISDQSTVEERRCISFTNLTAVSNLPLFLFFVLVAMHLGDLLFLILTIVGFLATFGTLALNAAKKYWEGRVLLTAYPCLYILFCWSHFDLGGMVPLFLMGILIESFMMFPASDTKSLVSLVALVVLCFSLSIFSHFYITDPITIPSLDFDLIRYLLIFGCLIGIITFGWLFTHLHEKAVAEVVEEKRKSEDLLLHIFPAKIAEVMKEKGRVNVESYQEVTVLFAEICDFNQITGKMTADDVVELLNNVFILFEGLTEKRGLEKIKTVGEKYMVASGVPEPRKDHVEAAADLALDMQEAVRELKTSEDQPVQIKIGIHTGPVTAGVIGLKRFSYDIWGNTVNMASRMTQMGIPGRVQVSEEINARLCSRYNLEPRGEIKIKGKGAIPTWFLNSRQGPPGTSWKPSVEKLVKKSSTSQLDQFVNSTRRSRSS